MTAAHATLTVTVTDSVSVRYHYDPHNRRGVTRNPQFHRFWRSGLRDDHRHFVRGPRTTEPEPCNCYLERHHSYGIHRPAHAHRHRDANWDHFPRRRRICDFHVQRVDRRSEEHT